MVAHTHQTFNSFESLTHTHCCQIRNPKRANFYRKCLRPQAQSSAALTRNELKKFFKLLALCLSTGITELTLKDRQNSLKRPHIGLRLSITTIRLNLYRLATSIQQNIFLFISEILPRSLNFKPKSFSYGIQQREVVRIIFFCPRNDSGIHRLGWIWNHPINSEFSDVTNSMANLASSIRTVE